MKGNYRKYISVFLFLLLSMTAAVSQEAAFENMVVTAVEKMDAGDINGARTILEKVVKSTRRSSA